MNKIKKMKNKTSLNLEGDVVLRVENMSKKFCRTLKRSMYYGTIDIARSMMGINYDTGKLRKDEFWALDDVSFELKKGEALGIIGVNGSGKSTLLRLITGIFPPDKGRISFKGRIGALIAVGAGFHPHMTGRENIYLNGTILGITRKELDERLEDIIDFAEIGEFLDAPVSTYSSGMRVRLGFAIAVHCDPDILLVDEILSVGDLSFRNKSLRKMSEFRKKAKALIFISHNLEQVRILCDRVIVIDQGSVIFHGDTTEGIIRYEELTREQRVISNNKTFTTPGFLKRYTDGDRVYAVDIGLINDRGEKIDSISCDEPLNLFLDISVDEDQEELLAAFGIQNESRNTDCIRFFSNDYNKFEIKNIKAGKYRITASILQHNLSPGIYFINYAIRNSYTAEIFESAKTEKCFSVMSDALFENRGVCRVNEIWEMGIIDF